MRTEQEIRSAIEEYTAFLLKEQGICLSAEQKQIIFFPWHDASLTEEVKESTTYNLLVSAGAGSGKTFILLRRLLFRILYVPDFSLRKVLLISYTTASARKLKEEISQLLEKVLESAMLSKYRAKILDCLKEIHLISIQTVHAFCLGVLRENLGNLDLISKLYDTEFFLTEEFRVLDARESELLLTDTLDACFLDEFIRPESETTDFYHLIDTYDKTERRLKIKSTLLTAYKEAKAHPFYLEKIKEAQRKARAFKESKRKDLPYDLLRTDDLFAFFNYLKILVDSLSPTFSDLKEWLFLNTEVIFKTPKKDEEAKENLKLIINLYEETKKTLKDLFEERKEGHQPEINDYLLAWERLHLLRSDESVLNFSLKGVRLESFKTWIKKIKQSSFLDFFNASHSTSKISRFKYALKTSLEFGTLFPVLPYFSHNLDEYLADAYGDLASHTSFFDLLIKLDYSFQKLKLRKNVLDYSDFEHYALRLLSSDELHSKYAGIYDEIYLDEYQDISPLEEGIISLLGKKMLFMVGDIKQSIYRFRNACPEIFSFKEGHFRELKEEKENKVYNLVAKQELSENSFIKPSMDLEAKGSTSFDFTNSYLVRLKDNYRSHVDILKFVNSLMLVLMRSDFSEIAYTKGHLFSWSSSSEHKLSEQDLNYSREEERAVNLVFFEPLNARVEYLKKDEEVDSSVLDGQDTPNKTSNADELADEKKRMQEYVVTSVKFLLEKGVPPEEIAFLAPKNRYLLEYQVLLEEAGFLSPKAYEKTLGSSFPYLQVRALVNFCQNTSQDVDLLALLRGGFFFPSFTEEELLLLRHTSPLYLRTKSEMEEGRLSTEPLLSFSDVFLAYAKEIEEVDEETFFIAQQEFFANSTYINLLAKEVYGNLSTFLAKYKSFVFRLKNALNFFSNVIANFYLLPLGETLMRALLESDAEENLQNLYKTTEAFSKAHSNFEKLKYWLRALDERHLPLSEALDLFNNLALGQNLDETDSSASGEQDASIGVKKEGQFSFFTFHKSKGLEFQYVFLLGLEGSFNKDLENLINFSQANQTYKTKKTHFLRTDVDYLHPTNKEGFSLVTSGLERIEKDGILSVFFAEQDRIFASLFPQIFISRERQKLLAEKIRLLYVALTRAKNNLTLLVSSDWLNQTYTPSQKVRKVEEINLLNEVGVKKELSYYELSQANSYLEWLLLALFSYTSFSYQAGVQEICLGRNENENRIKIIGIDVDIEEEEMLTLVKNHFTKTSSQVEEEAEKEKTLKVETNKLEAKLEGTSSENNIFLTLDSALSDYEKTLSCLDSKLQESNSLLAQKTSVSKLKKRLLSVVEAEAKTTTADVAKDELIGTSPISTNKDSTYYQLSLKEAEITLPSYMNEFFKTEEKKTLNKSALSRPLNASERGNAFHHFCFHFPWGIMENKETKDEVIKEVEEHLAYFYEKKMLTVAEYNYLKSCIVEIGSLILSPLGQYLIRATKEGKLYREMPFNMLIKDPRLDKTSPSFYLQGIIDAWFLLDDKLVLIDYKTDKVNEQEVSAYLLDKYRVQLEFYALALQRAIKQEVSSAYLYHLPSSTIVDVPLQDERTFLIKVFDNLTSINLEEIIEKKNVDI